MTLEGYLANGFSPVDEITHDPIIIGTVVECNYLYCNYREKFDSVEDAEVAAGIHKENNAG
jgi:archaellum component FlaF (FlaF/FlaG flagellin family)